MVVNISKHCTYLFIGLFKCNILFVVVVYRSCMYISGMPGVGKTAMVREVARYLQGAVDEDMLPSFKFVEVNGMKVTAPPKIFISIVAVRMAPGGVVKAKVCLAGGSFVYIECAILIFCVVG